MILIKSFLTGVLYDCFKFIYAYLNEGDEVRECYGCLKMMIQVHLHVGFFTIFFIKRPSFKRFNLYMKLLQSSTVSKRKKIIMKCLAIKSFAWNFLQLPIKKKIATLRIVTIGKSELTFLLVLYFHYNTKFYSINLRLNLKDWKTELAV